MHSEMSLPVVTCDTRLGIEWADVDIDPTEIAALLAAEGFSRSEITGTSVYVHSGYASSDQDPVNRKPNQRLIRQAKFGQYTDRAHMATIFMGPIALLGTGRGQAVLDPTLLEGLQPTQGVDAYTSGIANRVLLHELGHRVIDRNGDLHKQGNEHSRNFLLAKRALVVAMGRHALTGVVAPRPLEIAPLLKRLGRYINEESALNVALAASINPHDIQGACDVLNREQYRTDPIEIACNAFANRNQDRRLISVRRT